MPPLAIVAGLIGLSVLPLPKAVSLGQPIQLGRAFKVIASDRQFEPVVGAFLDDWSLRRDPKGRTLRCSTDSSLNVEGYQLEIGSEIKLRVGSKTGLAWGLHTLGQILDGAPTKVKISDEPDVPFRCLMVDVARRYHSPSTLRTLIRWCQAGKVRYMQLHLTDDQNWMFPSKVLKGVDSRNRHGYPAYTREELAGLQAFASSRGVTLIPEIDIPGHSSLLTALDPDLFRIMGSESTNCINFASLKVRSTMKQLLSEVADVFGESPYIHIGGDEAWYPNAEKDPEFALAVAREGSASNVFVDFVGSMSEEVLRLKKRPLIWEGFSAGEYAKRHIPKKAVIVAWEGTYYPASQLIPDGFTIVNGGWDPNYVVNHYPYEMFTLVPLERLYRMKPQVFGIVAWNGGQDPKFEFQNRKQVLGSLMCWWEGHEWNAQNYLPSRILAFGARLWNSKDETGYTSFLSRAAHLSAKVERQAFPFIVQTSGVLKNEPPQFESQATLSVIQPKKGLKFGWRTDGRIPTAADIRTEDKLTITEGKVVTIQAFKGVNAVGETRFFPFSKVNVVKSLTYVCKVKTSGDTDPQFPGSCVTDGVSDQLSAYWFAYPNPQKLTIDLGKPVELNRISVVAFWATGDPTKYQLSLSVDGTNWNEVADTSAQVAPTTAKGYDHIFPTQTARYIQMITLGGPLFPSTMTRINEIRAFRDH